MNRVWILIIVKQPAVFRFSVLLMQLYLSNLSAKGPFLRVK